MKHVSKNRPDIIAPYIEDMVRYIDYRVPRVRWGIPEAIGNMAKRFPNEVVKAIPKLLVNTKDDGTVVRWCAAFALSEIVRNNPRVSPELVPKIEETVKNEQNNGVKNVYLKALKTISNC